MTELPVEYGAFHVEFFDDAFGVYDSYMQKTFLWFSTEPEAVSAARDLAVAADSSVDDLNATYARLLPLARRSLEDVSA